MPRICVGTFVAAVALAVLCPGVRADPVVRYVDLAGEFSRFADQTTGMKDAARIAAFKAHMEPLLPGFYVPRFGATPERYDAKIAHSLETFAVLRPKYEQVRGDFPAAFDAGMQHFRKVFPGFAPDIPVYLLHSLGEMDGGLRELGGKNYLIFGADVIADIHDRHTLTPFLDHELFHVENRKYFSDCEKLWCLLWEEGLATYAAKIMNPGADDRQLLLTSPKPIRAAVDASWPAALCFAREKLSSAEPADMDALLTGGAASGGFPERFGYYVGLRVIEELGGEFTLPVLAQMPRNQARSAFMTGFDRLIKKGGGCRQPQTIRSE